MHQLENQTKKMTIPDEWNPQSTHLVLYDGVCGLCNRSVQWILIRDAERHVQYAPLQSHLARSLLTKHDIEVNEISTAFVVRAPFTKDDKVFAGPKAAMEILSALPTPWPFIGRLLGLTPNFLNQTAYNLVAKYRYSLLGKADACILPLPAQRAQFIDPEAKRPAHQ
jgi:predicted DCC family thiol-disulfide oxidoreductase YuxK